MGRPFSVALVGCSLLALLSTAEFYVSMRAVGHPVSIAHALLRESPPWLVWAACAPSIARRGGSSSIDWPPSVVASLAHLGGAAVATLVFGLVRSTVEVSFGLQMTPMPALDYTRDTLVMLAPAGTIIYAATVGVGYAAAYGRRSREFAESQAQLALAQLSALRMQLNPHFLFNTLHTISALVLQRDERSAVDVIERLGDVLRYLLESDSAATAPLRDELAFVRRYLEIEHARFGDRLGVSWAVEPAAETALVPQLIVQPLVENALKHGLAPRAEGGALAISVRVAGGSLEIAVADDGVGLPEAADDARPGVGLANIRARLAKIYGRAASLAVEPAPGGGAIARVTLPFRSQPGVAR